jgi:transposase InsO family protein
MIMGFIDQMRAEGHAVESVCRVLRGQGCQVAARTYRDWKRASPSARDLEDAYLMDEIWDLFHVRDERTGAWRPSAESLYGRRKVTAWLRANGRPEVAHCAVARALKAMGHRGIRRGRRVRTTVPAKDGRRAGDLLNRDFTAEAPNRVWVTDFTYVRTWAGFVYVAFILDVFSRRIVAWHASMSKQTDLVMIPLRMALWQRERDGHPVVAGELIHHSDAGSQYTSIRLTERLDLERIAASIGSVGDAYDNALMESGNGLYKTECIFTTIFHDGAYKGLVDVEYATAGWVEWYNSRRLHSAIGQQSPAQFENAYYAGLTTEEQLI